MEQKLELTVDAPGNRLDKYLAEQCRISRAEAQRLIDRGRVSVDGQKNVTNKLKLKPGDRVSVNLPAPSPVSVTPEDIPLKVVYEDSDVIVVDKPAGLVVHPAANQYSGTLVNALIARFPDLAVVGAPLRPGIVHRLDKDTSGLMMVARNAAAYLDLTRQIKERSVTKGYLALVAGTLIPEHGAVEAPVGRHPRDRKRMAVVSGGKPARTQYRVLKYVRNYTLVEAIPETGRTHQIRVHFASIGHPVAGDPVYGKRVPFLARQFLHACRLGFTLPSSGKYVEFASELPPDLEEALKQLGE